ARSAQLSSNRPARDSAGGSGLLVISHGRQALVDVGAEVAQAHERFGAGVPEGHALLRALVGDEHLVVRDLAVADEVRAVDGELADRTAALRDDETIRAGVVDRDRAAGEDGQLAGAEKLLAVDGAVDDPLVDVALAVAAGGDDRLKVVVVLESGATVF